MADTFSSLDKQIAEIEENLRLIAERKSEFVEAEKIDLDLIKNERRLLKELDDLRARRQRLHAVPCPYRGLEYFDVQHAANYFGRAAMVDKLLAKLRENNFVAVVGPSGCGKSSLVRAGLIPALADDALSGNRTCQIDVFRPGDDPLHSLALPLVVRLMSDASPIDRLAEARKLAGRLAAGDPPIADVLKGVLAPLPPSARLLLFADQFEETFTLCTDEARRRAFLNALLAAADTLRVTVLFALRADFFGHVLADECFGQRVDAGQVNVLPMTADERRAAIEQPALRAGATFEKGLVERILDAVTDAPGDLPLLEFALTELWERQTAEGVLTHMAYEAIGEVRGAIAKRAEETLNDLRRRGLGEATRRLLTSLVHLTATGAGTGMRRRKTVIQPDAEVSKVVRILTDTRLVVTGRDESTGDPTVELAHDALITEWKTLQGWLNEDREFLLWRQRMRDRLNEWETQERDTEALIHGKAVEEALDWFRRRGADLTQGEKRYVRDSAALQSSKRAADEREIRVREQMRRRIIYGVSGAAVVLLILALLAGIGWQEARKRGQRAEEQRQVAVARQLAAQAQLISQNTSTERGALLAAESLQRLSSSPGASQFEADQALRSALDALPSLIAETETSPNYLYSTFSQDGSCIAFGGKDGAVQVVEVISQRNLMTLNPKDSVGSVAIAPNCMWLATVRDSGAVQLWNIATGTEKGAIDQGDSVSALAFSQDGKILAAGTSHGMVTVLGVPEMTTVARLNYQSQVTALALSPDGHLLAVGTVGLPVGPEGLVLVRDIEANRDLAQIDHANGIVGVIAFSPDGTKVASGAGEAIGYHSAVVAEAETGRIISQVTHEVGVAALAFSPDGTQIVSAGWDGVRVWNTSTGRESVKIASEEPILNVIYSGSHPRIATRNADRLRVWEVRSGQEMFKVHHADLVWSVAFSHDSKWLAASSWDGVATISEISTGRKMVEVKTNDILEHVTFSPDDKLIATKGRESVQIWEAQTGQQIATIVPEYRVAKVVFSPDGKLLAAASGAQMAWSGQTQLWEVANGKEIARLPHGNLVEDVAFSPDGRSVATGSFDGTARVWDVSSSAEVLRLPHDNAVRTVAFSPDGRWLATGCDDSVARIWDLASHKLLAQIKHPNAVHIVRFSSNGEKLITADLGHTVQIWDVLNGKITAAIQLRRSAWALALSPDSQQLGIASGDRIAGVWDLSTGDKLVQVAHDSGVLDIAFSPDGRWLATGSEDRTARVWRLWPADLLSEVCSRLTRNLTIDEWHRYLPGEPYRKTCENLP